MICVPISTSSRGSSAFTLACVPTGIKTGVSIVPCAVCNRPNRARLAESFLISSNTAQSFGQKRIQINSILYNSVARRSFVQQLRRRSEPRHLGCYESEAIPEGRPCKLLGGNDGSGR